ncbi:MAG TPA: methyltransferase domain-containing protein [Candidatus Hydrogenedentes bacterium]|nr:methyltransferase domain-containing protein [Candidatus Hydrogenedentota bacterium]
MDVFMKTAAFYLRALYLLARKRVITPDVIRRDYDRLSGGYDGYFSRHMAKHSLAMVARLAIAPGNRMLDLACGTGTITLELAQRAQAGEVVAIDNSIGMLERAREKARSLQLNNITFIQGDLIDEIRKLPAAHFDIVTCGWAIAYVKPNVLLGEIRRVLKPGGIVGIIENRRDTLLEVRNTSIKVAGQFPSKMQYLMDLHLRLPRSKKHLCAMFRKVKLTPMDAWEGCEWFSFADGQEALHWVLHTGASAGFESMMAPEKQAECHRLFAAFIERDYAKDGRIAVAHRFVAGSARKDAK